MVSTNQLNEGQSARGERDANISLRGRAEPPPKRLIGCIIIAQSTHHLMCRIWSLVGVNRGKIEITYSCKKRWSHLSTISQIFYFPSSHLSSSSHYLWFQQFTFESHFPLLRCGEVRWHPYLPFFLLVGQEKHSSALWHGKSSGISSDKWQWQPHRWLVFSKISQIDTRVNNV